MLSSVSSALPKHRELDGRLDAVGARRAVDLQHDLPDLKILERRPEIVADGGHDVAGEGLFIESLALLAQRDCGIGGLLALSSLMARTSFSSLSCSVGDKVPDHAEIEQCQAPVPGDEDVARGADRRETDRR